MLHFDFKKKIIICSKKKGNERMHYIHRTKEESTSYRSNHRNGRFYTPTSNIYSATLITMLKEIARTGASLQGQKTCHEA